MGSMTVTVFASGSTGNCSLISRGNTHILLDAGISARRIGTCLAGWGLSPADLSAILITHPHSDHISGLDTLTKRCPAPVYATPPVVRQLLYRLPIDDRVHTCAPGEAFSVGELTVLPIPTSHDTPGSAGYRFTSPDGRSVCVVTDLGVVTDAVEAGVRGVDLAVIECNHDADWVRAGPYPFSLKRRILGKEGHLCNEDGAYLCALAAESGAHGVILAHLSQQNNSPQQALTAVQSALSGFPQVTIDVAPVFSEGLRREV